MPLVVHLNNRNGHRCAIFLVAHDQALFRQHEAELILIDLFLLSYEYRAVTNGQ